MWIKSRFVEAYWQVDRPAGRQTDRQVRITLLNGGMKSKVADVGWDAQVRRMRWLQCKGEWLDEETEGLWQNPPVKGQIPDVPTGQSGSWSLGAETWADTWNLGWGWGLGWYLGTWGWAEVDQETSGRLSGAGQGDRMTRRVETFWWKDRRMTSLVEPFRRTGRRLVAKVEHLWWSAAKAEPPSPLAVTPVSRTMNMCARRGTWHWHGSTTPFKVFCTSSRGVLGVLAVAWGEVYVRYSFSAC